MYALNKYCYQCFHMDCDREFVCSQQMKATNNSHKGVIEIKRFGEPEVLVHFGRKCRFQSFLESGYTLHNIAAAYHRNRALLVLYNLQECTCNFAFPLFNLQTGVITAYLSAPRKSMMVVHCQISPDCQYTAILFYSRSQETLLFSYDLYLYCNETEEIVDCITINHEVHPYVIFDPRYKWSRVAIANYECKDAGIQHELVTYSIRDHSVVVRGNMSFRSSHFNLLFSKDGQFLILQELSDNRLDPFNDPIDSGIYIFDSDRLVVMKYLTCSLRVLNCSCRLNPQDRLLSMKDRTCYPNGVPFLNSICRVNFEPVFSGCGSYMRVVDYQERDGFSDYEPTVQIYQVPRELTLQGQCRVVIIQALKSVDHVKSLPLPESMKLFLTFVQLKN